MHMQPVSTHGAPKISMDSRDSDYQMKLKQAQAQADGNQFVMGLQSVGNAVKNSRTGYGAPSMMPNEVVEGAGNNFAQPDTTANMPLEDPKNTTGSVDLETSATDIPDQDPNSFQTDALDRRMAMYQRAAGNAGMNLNANRRDM
jgi:hypothetical protein